MTDEVARRTVERGVRGTGAGRDKPVPYDCGGWDLKKEHAL